MFYIHVFEHLLTESVGWQLEQLLKCQSVEETSRLHETGNHAAVVDILLQTFSSDKHKVLVMPSTWFIKLLY